MPATVHIEEGRRGIRADADVACEVGCAPRAHMKDIRLVRAFSAPDVRLRRGERGLKTCRAERGKITSEQVHDVITLSLQTSRGGRGADADVAIVVNPHFWSRQQPAGVKIQVIVPVTSAHNGLSRRVVPETNASDVRVEKASIGGVIIYPDKYRRLNRGTRSHARCAPRHVQRFGGAGG